MSKWTPEWDQYLVDTQHLSAREIATHLGITPHAVYQRRSKLGIYFHQTKTVKVKPGMKVKWPPTMKRIRSFIMKRDNETCYYCGEKATQIDHLLPVVYGGLNVSSNLVASCARCNNLKGTSCPDCPRFREKINV